MDASYYHSASSKPLIYATYWDVLDRHVNSVPEKEAFIFYDGDECNFRATFKQISNEVLEKSALLVSKLPWLKCGDRLAIVGSNRSEVLLAELVAHRLGLPVVFPPKAAEDRETLLEVLNLTKCAGIIIESTYMSQAELSLLLQQVVTLKFAIVFGPKAEDFKGDDVAAWNSVFDRSKYSDDMAEVVKQRFSQVKPEMEAVVYFSSGSTGKPKAAVWSHFGLVNNGELFAEMNKCDYNTTYLQNLPITCGAGATFSTRITAMSGATVIILNTSPTEKATDSNTMYKIIQEEKVNKLLMVGNMMLEFMEKPNATEINLQTANTAGQVLNMEYVGSINKKLPNLHIADVYGSTEMQVVLVNDITTTVGFTGKPLPHMEVKVINEHGYPVEVGKPGELCIRSAVSMLGYVQPEGAMFGKDKHGWFHSDDVVLMNEKREIKILGRMSDVIRRGGILVFHAPIEAVLSGHKKVHQVQVVAVSDQILYQEVCACIIPNDPTLTEWELQEWCSNKFLTENTAPPRYYIFMESFPLLASGKIARKKLSTIAEDKIHGTVC